VEDQSGLPNRENKWIGFISQTIKKPIVQFGLGIIGLVLLGVIIFGIRQAQLPPPQPLQFPHEKHVSLGIQCLFCHPGALRGQSPGLPTVSKCNGCHQQVKKSNPELAKLAAYVKNNEPITWVPVALVPDFVYYSHRPHIAAGLNCENCHAEIGQMTVAVPQKMDTGWCIGCHRTRYKNDPVMLTKLTDCATCHK
jgi:Cytochrome c7 and related cytochrome c